ncbi:hypothetical protein HDU96_002245 [Phlyctochytrium bullatum]|nr:hypothetical protein HDU96_002245 [Phlyctochytrium bullatum]
MDGSEKMKIGHETEKDIKANLSWEGVGVSIKLVERSEIEVPDNKISGKSDKVNDFPTPGSSDEPPADFPAPGSIDEQLKNIIGNQSSEVKTHGERREVDAEPLRDKTKVGTLYR